MTRRCVTDGQYGSLMRRLLELARRVDEGTIPLFPTMGALQKLIDEGSNTTRFLNFVVELMLPPQEAFFATKKFREGETVDGVKIASCNETFKKNFLEGREKIEEACVSGGLLIQSLGVDSQDVPIISELGDRAEIRLGSFWEALKEQTESSSRILNVNGESNIAYVRDGHYVLWAISAYWTREGWRIRAEPLQGDRWCAKTRVLSLL